MMKGFTYFEPLVLKNFLDGHQFTGLTKFGLVDNTKTTITNHFSICVSHFLSSIRSLSRGCHHCGDLAPIFTYKNGKINERMLLERKNLAKQERNR